MSKYDPLWEYIKTNAPSELSFDEVRRICGFPIDHAFLNCKKELEAYGYQIGKISMKNQTVKIHPWKEAARIETMIKTKRLRIYPATQEQMKAFIAAETDAELKKAYTEMLDGCLRYPDQWLWYAMWMIEQRDGTHIGDLCFKGLDANGAVEIGYGILEEHQGHGYATEAVGAAVNWALQQPCVTRVDAETEPDNRASQRVLEKCGFLPSGTVGEEGPRFFKTVSNL